MRNRAFFSTLPDLMVLTEQYRQTYNRVRSPASWAQAFTSVDRDGARLVRLPLPHRPFIWSTRPTGRSLAGGSFLGELAPPLAHAVPDDDRAESLNVEDDGVYQKQGLDARIGSVHRKQEVDQPHKSACHQDVARNFEEAH